VNTTLLMLRLEDPSQGFCLMGKGELCSAWGSPACPSTGLLSTSTGVKRQVASSPQSHFICCFGRLPLEVVQG